MFVHLCSNSQSLYLSHLFWDTQCAKVCENTYFVLCRHQESKTRVGLGT